MAPLWEMCKHGNLAGVRAALARGEDVNFKDISKKNGSDITGLMCAVILKHNSIVRLFLEQPTLDLNYSDGGYGLTALHCAAHAENVEAVRMLLADPRLTTANHYDWAGRTPVMAAMLKNNVDALRELVAHPSVDLDTRDGRSLEEWAR